MSKVEKLQTLALNCLCKVIKNECINQNIISKRSEEVNLTELTDYLKRFKLPINIIRDITLNLSSKEKLFYRVCKAWWSFANIITPCSHCNELAFILDMYLDYCELSGDLQQLFPEDYKFWSDNKHEIGMTFYYYIEALYGSPDDFLYKRVVKKIHNRDDFPDSYMNERKDPKVICQKCSTLGQSNVSK